MKLTLRKTIPSSSHNAPYSEELGEHWPEGQEFKLCDKRLQESLRQRGRIKPTSTVVEQIGGEEVKVAIPDKDFYDLFGIHPPLSLPTKKDGKVKIEGPGDKVAWLKKCSSGRDWNLKIEGVNDHSRFGNAEHIREDVEHFRLTGSLPRGERW